MFFFFAIGSTLQQSLPSSRSLVFVFKRHFATPKCLHFHEGTQPCEQFQSVFAVCLTNPYDRFAAHFFAQKHLILWSKCVFVCLGECACAWITPLVSRISNIHQQRAGVDGMAAHKLSHIPIIRLWPRTKSSEMETAPRLVYSRLWAHRLTPIRPSQTHTHMYWFYCIDRASACRVCRYTGCRFFRTESTQFIRPFLCSSRIAGDLFIAANGMRLTHGD